MPPFLTERRKPGWMAVLPKGGTLTLVHAERRGEARPEIRLLETFSLEEGAPEALQRLRAARQLKAHACTTLMAAGEYSITQLDAPAVPREERKEALRWALKESVAYPVDTACIEVLDIPGDAHAPGRASSVLVVSAPEQAVRARVAPFEAAGIRLAAVDVPELAQRNVAALLEDENRGLVLLRIDEDGLMLTLSFRGELVAVRRDERDMRGLCDGDAQLRASMVERLTLELQRSLDNFDRQYSYIPVSRVVLATPLAVDSLAADLAANTYVPLQEMDLSAVLDLAQVPELKNVRHQARHLLAIGAALRGGAPS